MKNPHHEYRDQLKNILDHCALDTLLVMLSEIAYLKADHLRSNWQDSKSALLWHRAGHWLERASQAVPISEVSIHARRHI
jgi:hypothetical protein